MAQLHGLAAQVALALSVFVAVSGIVLAAAKRPPPPFVLGGFVWAGIAVAIAGLAGIVVAVANPPGDPLHVVYGLLATAALPGTALVARGREGSAQAFVWAVGGIVFVILVLRLFQTAA